MKGMAAVIMMGAAAALATTAALADAAELRARCDYRNGSVERTKISVDLKDVGAGDYTATVNGRYVASGVVTPPDDEVEFDFDSNRANIRRGATAIPKHLGAAGSVYVDVENVVGTTLSCPGETTVVVPGR